MAMNELWAYREPSWRDIKLEGYQVEALDGTVGTVRETLDTPGSSYVVVDTGPWIFGKKVVLPAGVVDRVHPHDQKLYVERTKDAVKEAPRFDEDRAEDPAYLAEVGDYYGVLGGARSVSV